MKKSTFDPFEALHIALSEKAQIQQDPSIRLDLHRLKRTGIPELVRAEHKPVEIVIESLRKLAHAHGRAIAYKCSEETIEVITSHLKKTYTILPYPRARIIIVAKPDHTTTATGGKIGVISAGTSDIPIGEEAAIIAEEMGVKVSRIWDVGVAGLHRLIQPINTLINENVDAIIVVAGMDGSLAVVVTGLVSIPIIGLPTSTGYGFGGEGLGALTTMLQSCAPGLTVVNIDNGVGAGIAAARIANIATNARKRK